MVRKISHPIYGARESCSLLLSLMNSLTASAGWLKILFVFLALQTSYESASTVQAAELQRGVTLRGGAREMVHIRPNSASTINDSELRIGHGHSYEARSYDQEKSTFLRDLVGSIALYGKEVVSAATFRGAKDAIHDTNVTYNLPARAPLRHSMLHTTRPYEEMRGGGAGVGDSIALALRGSNSTQARLARANVDKARVLGVVAAFLPRVELTARTGLGPRDGSTSNNGQTRTSSATLNVSMPIFTSGANLNTYRQAKHVSIASDYSYLAEERKVALEAVTAHINLSLNRRIEQVLRANVRAMKRIALISRRLFEAGDSSRTDIAVAQANVENSRAELNLSRRTVRELEIEYVGLTGKNAPKKLRLPNAHRLLASSVDEAVEMAWRNNPSIKASEHTTKARRHAAKAEVGRLGPQVQLFGNYTKELQSDSADELNSSWSAGVQLTVPLFDAALAANVSAAKSEAFEARFQQQDLALRIEKEVRVKWAAYYNATKRVSIIKRQRRAVAASLEGTRQEFKAGFRPIADVLNDQVKLAGTDISLESVKHERLLAAFELAFTSAHPEILHLASLN